ncbi:MAG: hypothetical protein ABEJ82_04010 [Haloplanus sp.]
MSSADDREAAESRALDRWPRIDLDHVIEASEDVRQCTMYPSSTNEDQRLTAWITADEGAYVGIDDVR